MKGCAKLMEKLLVKDSRSFILSSPVYMTAFRLIYWDMGRFEWDKVIDVNNFYL